MEFLTNDEVMALLKISRATLYRLLEAGLPGIGSGRLRRFEREEVLHWFVGRGGGKTSEAPPPPGVLPMFEQCGVVDVPTPSPVRV